MKQKTVNQVVVSTHFKNMSQLGSFLRVGVKIKRVWNHDLVNKATSLLTKRLSVRSFEREALVDLESSKLNRTSFDKPCINIRTNHDKPLVDCHILTIFHHAISVLPRLTYISRYEPTVSDSRFFLGAATCSDRHLLHLFFSGRLGDDAMQKVRWITPTRRTDEPNLTHN